MKKSLFIFALMLCASTMLSAQVKPEKLEYKMRGRVYFDATGFLNNNETYLGSGSTISDVRLGISGKYGNFESKIELGYAKKAISFKDVYLAYHFNKTSYVRLGHYAEPFGIDYMESSGDIKFIDAGIVMSAFAPGRSYGLEYVGWSKNFWFGGGIFGDSHFAERTSYVGNDGYAVTGRLVFDPIAEQGKIFHVGVVASYRTPNANSDGAKERSVSYGTTYGTKINSVKPISASISDVEATTKLGGELVAAIGKVSFQGEYIYTSSSRNNGLKTYDAYGTYGQMSFLLIGDDYSYSKSWSRLEMPKSGSLELAARFAQVNLNCSDANINGGIQNQLTVACNYYWTSFLRLRLNYDMAHVKDYKSVNSISARVQLFF